MDKYKSADDDEKTDVSSVVLCGGARKNLSAMRRGVRHGRILSEGTNYTPATSSTRPVTRKRPPALADIARAMARREGLKCRVLDEKQMARQKMDAILSVGQGSSEPPRMVVLEYQAPRRQETETHRLRRQGGDVRYRGHLHQAERWSRTHDDRHERGSRRAGRDARRRSFEAPRARDRRGGPCGEHGGRRRHAARRHRALHEGNDYRNPQHGRRGQARPRRRLALHAREIRPPVHDRPGHAHRCVHGGAGPEGHRHVRNAR